MPSLIQGYEYDIFISYRHKDNKYDGWVTEFVTNLRKELEATFKEDISIYFDENPHDGLLETHDVDDSLKDKLKSLIFIPIISRTYCDSKSFAWNNEFLPFLKTAATDSYGLKVRLPNSNTGSRVLPIRIHELDANDKRVIEAELQGPLRAIDFTFQTSGVNRPLRPKDDETIKGSGQISYRDQINKTANAISDIIAGLQGKEQSTTPSPPERGQGGEASYLPHLRLPRRNWKIRMPVLNKMGLISALIVSLLSLIALTVLHFSEAPQESSTYRATILPPEKTRFGTNFGGNIALSPDGSSLAFAARDSTGKTRLWVRPLNALEARALNGTEGATIPFWAPDSRLIGFFADGKLKKIEVSGGPAQTLCDAPFGRGGSWNKEGTIIFNGSASGPLSRVSAAGGQAMRLTKLDSNRSEVSHRWPSFLPDGLHFLYVSRISNSGVTEDDAIFLASLDTTVTPRIVARASSSVDYANGHILFARGPTLMAQPFDLMELQTSGDAFPIAEHIYFESSTSKAAFSVSQNGILVYQTGGVVDVGLKLLWKDGSGKQTGSLSHAGSLYVSLRLSPDGGRIAISHPDAKGNMDIWLYEISRAVWTRFTFDEGAARSAVWTPDGKMIVFASDRNKRRYDLYLRASSGAGSEELLLQSNQSKIPSDWSRDGQFIAYHSVNLNGDNNDIWILSMNPGVASEERKPFVFLQTKYNELRATFSPDGRWIAYQSNESGRDEIYIRPFPGPGGKWQVSTAGGSRPRWSGDGKELFFMSVDFKIMAADIRLSSSTVDVGSVQSLFESGIFAGYVRDLYDVTQDGKRFLIESPTGNDISSPVTLVVNWPGEIKKR